MELYFKDLESEAADNDYSLAGQGDTVADERSDSAEEAAFAELAGRVCAARLVY